jgi:hypothetical protein
VIPEDIPYAWVPLTERVQPFPRPPDLMREVQPGLREISGYDTGIRVRQILRAISLKIGMDIRQADKSQGMLFFQNHGLNR